MAKDVSDSDFRMLLWRSDVAKAKMQQDKEQAEKSARHYEAVQARVAMTKYPDKKRFKKTTEHTTGTVTFTPRTSSSSSSNSSSSSSSSSSTKTAATARAGLAFSAAAAPQTQTPEPAPKLED